MIVNADPHGDFNATSQILRYSALAREIAVPRMPSITQTILSAASASASAATGPPPSQGTCSSPLGSPPHHRPYSPGGIGSSPSGPSDLDGASALSQSHRSTMEQAALEIARLAEELEHARRAAARERDLRHEAEAHLLSLEDRMVELEQVVREDCAAEFERRLEIESARWRANMQVEMERGEEHWGRKIDVFERTLTAAAAAAAVVTEREENQENGGGAEDKENVLMEDVNEENERLRRDNEVLRRELAAMSPTRRLPLQERGSDVAAPNGARTLVAESGSPRQRQLPPHGRGTRQSLQRKMETLRISGDGDGDGASVRGVSGGGGGGGSPKKIRKLPAKRWDTIALDVDGGDDMF